MRAIVIAAPGPPDVLTLAERPRPSPGRGELLIEVAAAGVNRPDVLQRLGQYAPPSGVSDLPGLEIAGTVAEAGEGTSRWQVGDRVCALVAGGGYAEFCLAPEPQCLPIPSGMALPEAAAIPETYFTVWSNVFQRGRLKHGERMLVHGGASGIGTTAIQLARALGASVIATAGSDERCRAVAKLGATAVNYRTADFVEAVKEATGGRGVNLILDIVGGEYLQRNLESLAMDGRLVQIGLLGGSRAQLSLSTIMQRRLTLTGSTLRSRPVEEKGAIARELEAHVWPLLEAGTVAPIVQTTLPLDRAADAHRMMEVGEVIGKLVLIP